MSWDVIVVGAGSAGCVVAARASEDGRRRVLLLEAGDDVVDLPGPQADALGSPAFWRAMAVPGRLWPGLDAVHVAGQAPRPYARGRGVGGSGAVNAMIALSPLPEDHADWAAAGMTSWSWDDARPWYERLRDGPLSFETVPAHRRGPVHRAFVAGARSLGFVPEDVVLTSRGGRRAGVADGYLAPARERPNLEVRTGAVVDRVRFEGTTAVGVRLVGGEELSAGRVVLCAGALHSPAVLLRSGVARPGVGRGLQDHPALTLRLPLAPDARVSDDDHAPVASLVRASSGTVPGDLQFLAFQSTGVGAAGRATGLLMVALMHVRSRGSVRLGGDGWSPVVELGMLGDADGDDLRRLRVGVRSAVRLAATAPVRALGGEPLAPDDTPLSVIGAMDDDALDDLLRRCAGDYVHASSTCRTGPADDPAAVVDDEGRVHGCHGLYVVDASVFPSVPRANTHLPVVATAERAARRWFPPPG